MKRMIDLPYELNALEPEISRETLNFHYNKHHRGYDEKLQGLIKDSKLSEKPLDYLVKHESGQIYNNAAQIWNHNFYWQCLTKKETMPSEKLSGLIEKEFGSKKKLEEALQESGNKHFGSGYVWLLYVNRKLVVKSASNAWCPITDKGIPLLTIDIWEHAYYIDFRNEKKSYLEEIIGLLNWDFASKQLED